MSTIYRMYNAVLRGSSYTLLIPPQHGMLELPAMVLMVVLSSRRIRAVTMKASARYTGKPFLSCIHLSSDNFRVNNVSFSEDGQALELATTRTTWQAAFDHVDVAFGHTKEEHLYRRHADFARLRKRQSTLAIPADTPDDITTVSFDLKSELLNTVFNVKDFLKGVVDINVPDVPIEIGCKECSTRGQLALMQGAFKIDASQIDLIPDIFQGGDDGKSINSVITGGFMELVATGVGARVELFARPAQSCSFEVALFSVPIVGFTIPGIGKAGAVFTPSIAADFEISGTLEVNYGLDLTVSKHFPATCIDTDCSRYLMGPAFG